jgi:PEP-CTERM motif
MGMEFTGYQIHTLTYATLVISSAPEPSSLILLSFGLVALVGVAKLRLFA